MFDFFPSVPILKFFYLIRILTVDTFFIIKYFYVFNFIKILQPPVPGLRPPIGAGGHVQSQKSDTTMSILMPMYTIGIVIFFGYTILKVSVTKMIMMMMIYDLLSEFLSGVLLLTFVVDLLFS